ncbi:MAG: hypothetical protein KUG65_06430 [Sphingomonadaceae bacterium]|nr:hypothetical protein [Sphingomonadaceae bacterium]
MQGMARVVTLSRALTHMPLRQLQEEFLRSSIVCSCAIALIAAGTALPI